MGSKEDGVFRSPAMRQRQGKDTVPGVNATSTLITKLQASLISLLHRY